MKSQDVLVEEEEADLASFVVLNGEHDLTFENGPCPSHANCQQPDCIQFFFCCNATCNCAVWG